MGGRAPHQIPQLRGDGGRSFATRFLSAFQTYKRAQTMAQ